MCLRYHKEAGNIVEFSVRRKIGNQANFLVSDLMKSIKIIMKEEINFNGTTKCGSDSLKSFENIKVWLKWPELEQGQVKSHLQELLNYSLFKKFENMTDKEKVTFK